MLVLATSKHVHSKANYCHTLRQEGKPPFYNRPDPLTFIVILPITHLVLGPTSSDKDGGGVKCHEAILHV